MHKATYAQATIKQPLHMIRLQLILVPNGFTRLLGPRHAVPILTTPVESIHPHQELMYYTALCSADETEESACLVSLIDESAYSHT